MLTAILSTIRFLGRQGLALCGRYKAGENVDDKGGEHDSNFLQPLKLRTDDIPGLLLDEPITGKIHKPRYTK